MKKTLTIILVILIVISSFVILKNQIAALIVERVVGVVTGAPIKMDKVFLNLRTKTLTVEGFRIYNPRGFPEGILMDLPDLVIKYDRKDFWRGALHLYEVDAHIKQLVVVKRAEDGKLNVDALKFVPEEDDKTKMVKEKGALPVDSFNLTIDQVVYKDYTKGDPPSIQVFDLNIKDRNYKDLPGIGTVLTVALQEAMTKTAIQGAAIYGVVTVAGATFWPLGAAVLVVGNDSTTAEYNKTPEELYDAALKTLKEIGVIDRKRSDSGVIKAHVDAFDLAVQITSKGEGLSVIKVSARKYFIPRPSYAKTILYQISENIPK